MDARSQACSLRVGEWDIAGEGNRRVVLRPKRAQCRAVVLRLAKVKGDSSCERALDAALWSRFEWHMPDPASDSEVARFFLANAMRHMIDARYLPPSTPARIDPAEAAALLHALSAQRQERFWHETTVEELAEWAEDAAATPGPRPHTSDGSGLRRGSAAGRQVAFEIKPKSATLPLRAFLPDDRAFASQVPRYRMHQVFKAREGKVAAVSAYDPRDLLCCHEDGCRGCASSEGHDAGAGWGVGCEARGCVASVRSRKHRALEALARQPHNNFRVWMGGREATDRFQAAVQGGATAGQTVNGPGACISAEDLRRPRDETRTEAQAVSPDEAAVWLAVLTNVLCAEPVLGQVLSCQRLDVLGLEGAALALAELQDRWGSVTEHLDSGGVSSPDQPGGAKSGKQAVGRSEVAGAGGDPGAFDRAGLLGRLSVVRSAATQLQGGDAEGDAAGRAVAFVRDRDGDELCAVLAGLSVAQCARDLAVMVACEVIDGPGCVCGHSQIADNAGVGVCVACSCVTLPGSGAVRYRVTVVDADYKPLARLPEWLRREHAIWDAWAAANAAGD